MSESKEGSPKASETKKVLDDINKYVVSVIDKSKRHISDDNNVIVKLIFNKYIPEIIPHLTSEDAIKMFVDNFQSWFSLLNRKQVDGGTNVHQFITRCEIYASVPKTFETFDVIVKHIKEGKITRVIDYGCGLFFYYIEVLL